MKIYYVTGNDLKIKLANKIFNDLNVEVEQVNLNTPEIQSLSCEEVSKNSAKWACEKINKPVMKNDSGFCIEYLNNFPGPFAKYAEDTIKADGYIKLLQDTDNRNCYWIDVISYCEPGKDPVSFTSYSYGTISKEVREGRGYDYDKIFIPENDTRTFSEMTEEKQLSYFSNEPYLKLYEYLKEKENKND